MTDALWTVFSFAPSILAWLVAALAGGFVLRGRWGPAGLFVGGALLQLVNLAVDLAMSVAVNAAFSMGATSADAIGVFYGVVGVAQGLLTAVAWAMVFAGVFTGRASPPA